MKQHSNVNSVLGANEQQANAHRTSLRGLIEGTVHEHGKYAVTEWDYRSDTESACMIIQGG